MLANDEHTKLLATSLFSIQTKNNTLRLRKNLDVIKWLIYIFRRHKLLIAPTNPRTFSWKFFSSHFYFYSGVCKLGCTCLSLKSGRMMEINSKSRKQWEKPKVSVSTYIRRILYAIGAFMIRCMYQTTSHSIFQKKKTTS